MVDAVHYAWAAGIIDGEGCITIKKAHQGKNYVLHVIVGQSGDRIPKMLVKLQELFEGNVAQTAERRGTRRPKWSWQVVSCTAETTLTLVCPFLVEKQDQAIVALEYRATGVAKPGSRATEDQKIIAYNSYLKLREMKHYTKVHPKWTP